MLKVVYASPERKMREALWGRLAALQLTNGLAWLLSGDFNSIISATERIGGSRRRTGILHLNRNDSDHRPILLMTDSFSKVKCSNSFKYLSAWQSNRGFEEMLSETWQLNSPIVSNIGRFQASASKWKRDSFGHIGKWKHVLMARIRGIESVNERSRAQWVLDGDQNTKYRVTKAQHCRKVCSMIKLGDVTPWGIRGRFDQLSTAEMVSLTRDITMEERQFAGRMQQVNEGDGMCEGEYLARPIISGAQQLV
ncbi:hypothetical protein V6N13_015039 [Hibiscus sabdariffa]